MANLIATPRAWKKKAILAKLEASPGVDAAPTGAANWIEARNVTFEPMDAETVERDIIAPYFGNGGKLITAKYTKISFEVALVGSGAAGVAPKVAPLLLACAMAQTVTPATSVAYNLVSEAIQAVTIYVNVDGVLHKLVGCRGNVALTLAAKGIPLLKFDLESIYTTPAAEAMPAVDRDGWLIEKPVTAATTAALTLGGTALAYSACELNLGNQLARIDLPGPQTEVAILDRKPTASATVLAPALAVFDPFALAESGATLALATTQDAGAGRAAQLAAQVRVIGVDYDRIDEMLAYKLTLEPTPIAGNDEFALTYL
jgi:hypothetical protein